MERGPEERAVAKLGITGPADPYLRRIEHNAIEEEIE